MASLRRSSNDALEGPDTRRISAPHEARGGEPATVSDEGAALLRRALDVLEDVSRLLHALSPSEIEAEVTRLFLGRVGDDDAASRWRAYSKRHRVLKDLFATVHSEFAQASRAHFERLERDAGRDGS
jgi:hypothetical protein